MDVRGQLQGESETRVDCTGSERLTWSDVSSIERPVCKRTDRPMTRQSVTRYASWCF